MAKYNRRIGHIHFNVGTIGGGVNACPSNALLYSKSTALVTCPKCQTTKAYRAKVEAGLQGPS